MVALVLSSVFTISCDEFAEQFGVSIESDHYETELTVYPSKAGEHTFSFEAMDMDLQAILEENGKEDLNIKRIEVTQANLQVAGNSKVKDFRSVENLTTFISTDIHEEDTLSYVENYDPTAKVLSMNLINNDIAPYLEAGKYMVTLKGKLREDLNDTLMIKGTLRYKIVLGM